MSLDERFRNALADTLTEVRTRLEAEYSAVAAEQRAEAEQAAATAVSDAKTTLEQELRAAFDGEKAQLSAAHADVLAQAADAARLEVARLTETSTAELEAAKAEAAAALDAVRTELRDAQHAAQQQREELETAMGRLRFDHDAEVTRLRDELAAVTASRESAELALARFREDQETARTAMRADAEAALTAARAEGDARLAVLRAEADAKFAASHAETAALIASLRAEAHQAATQHSHVVEAHHVSLSRLLESVRALDGASSLTEVLDALAVAAGREASRAAVLVVKGDQLIGWKAHGFGDTDARSLSSGTADAGALANAVNTGRPAVVGAGSVLAPPPFATLPAEGAGLAVPLLVASKPVAVLYADHAAGAVAGWSAPLELLVRHAARCLEGLAVHRNAQAKAAPARLGATA